MVKGWFSKNGWSTISYELYVYVLYKIKTYETPKKYDCLTHFSAFHMQNIFAFGSSFIEVWSYGWSISQKVIIVQVISRHRGGNNPLPEIIMTPFSDACIIFSVPPCVNGCWTVSAKMLLTLDKICTLIRIQYSTNDRSFWQIRFLEKLGSVVLTIEFTVPVWMDCIWLQLFKGKQLRDGYCSALEKCVENLWPTKPRYVIPRQW